MLSLESYKKDIETLCKNHKVEELYVFGSATNETFNKNSDVDFLVKFKEFDLKYYFSNYSDFKSKLKKLLKREVDLLETQTLKNPYLINSIEKSKKLIYG